MKARALFIGVLVLAGVAAVAGPAEERARISRQRHALETRFAEQEAECRTRFSVTACVDDVKARRRDSMNVLREQELQLDDAERKQRAAQRLQALEAKRLQALARPAAPPPAPVTRVAPHGVARGAPEPREVRRPRDTAAEASAAAHRASAAEARRDAAAEDRAKIAAREAARAARPKQSAPLPLPPEVAGSGGGRR